MKYLGIDIGGTKCGVTIAEYENGDIAFIDKVTFPAEKEASPESVIKKLINESKEMLKKNGLLQKDIASIGINCGGPLDSKNGVILCPPNLIGWVNIPIVKIFEQAMGIKTYLENDANAGAIAEHLFGAGRNYEHLMFLTFGTGMGAGLILNNRLYSGASDMAGEVGHIRLDSFGPVGFGKAGSFEGFCSGGGIAQLARLKVLEKLQTGETVSFCENMKHIDAITAQVVAEAAKNSDPVAKDIFDITGAYLGKALSLFIDILNPQLIILGSIFGRAKELLVNSMYSVIEKETISFSRNAVKIVECGLGEKINNYEAVAIAVYYDRINYGMILSSVIS